MKEKWHDCWFEAEKERFGITERVCSCGARMVQDPYGVWVKLPREKPAFSVVKSPDGPVYTAGRA